MKIIKVNPEKKKVDKDVCVPGKIILAAGAGGDVNGRMAGDSGDFFLRNRIYYLLFSITIN